MPRWLSQVKRQIESLQMAVSLRRNRRRFHRMYLRKAPWDTGVSPPELLEFIRQHPPGRAVDLGCGTGTNLVTLARAGWHVTGIDFADHAVREAQKRLLSASYAGEVRAGDVSNLGTIRAKDGQAYDLVLDIGCYHTLSRQSRILYRQNLPLILSSGGCFLIYGHWSPDSRAEIGICGDDVIALSAVLDLENRQDSIDSRGRPAVWMLFAVKGSKETRQGREHA